jgi:hypothetical protein
MVSGRNRAFVAVGILFGEHQRNVFHPSPGPEAAASEGLRQAQVFGSNIDE